MTTLPLLSPPSILLPPHIMHPKSATEYSVARHPLPADKTGTMSAADRRDMLLGRRSGTLPLRSSAAPRLPLRNGVAQKDAGAGIVAEGAAKSGLSLKGGQPHRLISYSCVVELLSSHGGGGGNLQGPALPRRPAANASSFDFDCPDVRLRRRLNELEARDAAQRRRIETLRRAIEARRSFGAHFADCRQRMWQGRSAAAPSDSEERLERGRRSVRELEAHLLALREREEEEEGGDDACKALERKLRERREAAARIKTEFDATCDRLEGEADGAAAAAEREEVRSALRRRVEGQFQDSLKRVRRRAVTMAAAPEAEVRRQCLVLQRVSYKLSAVTAERQNHSHRKAELRSTAREVFRLTNRAVKYGSELVGSIPSQLDDTTICRKALASNLEAGKQTLVAMETAADVHRISVVFSLSAMANLMRLVGHYELDTKEDWLEELIPSSAEEEIPTTEAFCKDGGGSTVVTLSTATASSSSDRARRRDEPSLDRDRRGASELRSRLERRRSALRTLRSRRSEADASLSRLRAALGRARECADAESAVRVARTERWERKLRRAREEERDKGQTLDKLSEELGEWRKRVLERNGCSFRSMASL